MADKPAISLRTSMALLVLGAAVVGPLVAGSLIYRDAHQATIDNANRSLLAENTGKRRQLHVWINTAKEAVKLQAGLLADRLPGFKPNAAAELPELSRSFRTTADNSPLFDEIFYIDGVRGVVRASSDTGQVGKIREYDPYFVDARIGPHIEPPFFDLYYGDIVTIVAAPVHGSEPQAFGILGAYLSTDTIATSMAQTPGTFRTSDTYLLNRANLFVSAPNSVEKPELLRSGLHRPFLDDCQAGRSGLTTTTDFRSEPVYIAYSWLSSLKVCVVTQVSRSEIDAQLAAVTRDALVFGTAFAVVMAILGIATLVPINRSLERLLGGFGRFAAGDLAARIPETGFKEFGAIAHSYNEMAEKHEQAAAELVQARDAADTANRAKSRFVAAMSHEIRTPLNGVLGLIAIARERDTREEITKDLANAALAGEQLLFVVNQILDFSKIEAGKLTLAEEPFSPGRVLQSVASVMAPQASNKGLAFDLDIVDQEAPATLLGDSGRLRQVIFNLLGNAVKFTETGTVGLRARYEEADDGRCEMLVEVTDTGPGIDESFRNRLFEEFEQAGDPGMRQAGGTGLGLAIANRILHLMGSRLEFESHVGAGSRFYFRISLARGGDQPVAVKAPAAVPTRPLRILIAEDVDINRRVLRALLEKRGHTVFEAANGQACLDKLRAVEDIEVVLMDVHMPLMDGLTATRQIKLAISGFAHLPVIGLTANAFEEQRREYLDAGMDEVLAKPIDLLELDAALTRLAPTTPARSGEKAPEEADIASLRSSACEDETDEDVDGAQIDAIGECLGEEATEEVLEQGVARCRDLVYLLLSSEQSPADLQFQAHALKGVAGNIGLAGMASLARRIESAARNGEPTDALIAAAADTLTEQEARLAAYRSRQRLSA